MRISNSKNQTEKDKIWKPTYFAGSNNAERNDRGGAQTRRSARCSRLHCTRGHRQCRPHARTTRESSRVSRHHFKGLLERLEIKQEKFPGQSRLVIFHKKFLRYNFIMSYFSEFLEKVEKKLYWINEKGLSL